MTDQNINRKFAYFANCLMLFKKQTFHYTRRIIRQSM